MSPEFESFQRYARRAQLILKTVAVVLLIVFALDFVQGFIEGFQSARHSTGTHSEFTKHVSALVSNIQGVNILLFAVVMGLMVSILKEFEKGLFFSETVLRKTYKIGLYTELVCYLLIPLLSLYHEPLIATPLEWVSHYFSNINYAGGGAGTFIRYLSRLLLVGRTLQENEQLTI